jgi:pSer/pThr/pTyr-binding forkhead associated (FHA) protein
MSKQLWNGWPLSVTSDVILLKSNASCSRLNRREMFQLVRGARNRGRRRTRAGQVTRRVLARHVAVVYRRQNQIDSRIG